MTIDKDLEFGDVLNIPQADETGRIVERKEVSLFSPDGWREAVVNAFIHNSWIDGEGPFVSVFSDCIEIVSRGGLAPAQTVEGFFRGDSIPVNRVLSDVALQLHISERSGRGVPTIVREYGRSAIELRDNSIAVTIPFNRVGDPWIPTATEDRPRLNATRTAMLDAMRNNPNVTQAELGALAGIGKTAVANNLAWLRRSGYAERIGSPRSGYWRVL